MSPHGDELRRTSSRKRLPPRIVGRRRAAAAKSAGNPWYRRVWLAVPLVTCATFAILLAGYFVARPMIIAWRAPVDQRPDEPPEWPSENAAGSPAQSAAQPGLDSSEPGVEVLPPAAARLPGRAVRKLLLVGRHPRMFATISEAFALAIPGDIIEVRGNGPFLETGAERTFETYLPNAPITLRAGKGYQPVVQAGSVSGFQVHNADLVVAGLHLTNRLSATWFSLRDGQFAISDCTVTGILANDRMPGGVLCNLQLAARAPAPRQILAQRCLMRSACDLAFVSGPDAAVTVEDCAIAGGVVGTDFVTVIASENQSLAIARSTFVNSNILHYENLESAQGWPAQKMRFRMQQSVFGLLCCCPHLARVSLPKTLTLRTIEQAHAAFPLAFQEIAAENCVATYWEGWGMVDHGGPGIFLRDAAFEVLPPHDETLRFGKPFEDARRFIHEKLDNLSAVKATAALMPVDFLVSSSGPLQELRAAGVACGCDVRKLPVPPATTIEPYVLPAPRGI